MENYFSDRDKRNTMLLRELRSTLPSFCNDFFVGISTRTSVLTRLGYARDLNIFFDYLVEQGVIDSPTGKDITLRQLDGVTSGDIEAYLEYLSLYTYKGREYTNDNKAKLRKLSAVRALFKYLYNKDKLDENVASKVLSPKIAEHEIIRLENKEMADFLANVESGAALSTGNQQAYHRHTALRDTAIVSLLLGTGIRVSECVGLNIDDVDWDNNKFTVTRKGGNRTVLYLPDDVTEALQNYLAERLAIAAPTDALFLSLQQKRINVRTVQVLVKKYASGAVPTKHITPHKLRSTFGTNLYRETKDIYIVAEVLGHQDVNTTKKHYAAISEDIKQNAAKTVHLKPKENVSEN